jgi:amino acid adenylation domain-containing protein
MNALHDAVPLLNDYLSHSARRLPDKVALVFAKQRLTYGELDARANALAHALVAKGVQRGDRVMVFADNGVETVISFWAALKANAVISIVNSQTRSDKLRYLIKDCRPAALITDARLRAAWSGPAQSPHLRCVIVAGKLDEAWCESAPPLLGWEEAVALGDPGRPPARRNIDVDLAAIIYTSGSTGEPKGVMLTHRNMLSAATSISTYLEVQEDEVILNFLPLAFDYGLYQMIMAFRQGARLVLERSFSFPAQVVKLMAEEGVTGLPGVPPVFAILAEMKTLQQHDLSRIRYVTNTTAALPAKHVMALQGMFPGARIYSMYGLTECKRCTYLPPADLPRKPGSVGIAIPNTEMWIVDDLGRRVPPNTVGQLVIRGATVMKGYWEKPEATAKRLKPGPLPGEQVLHTGDYCKMDDDGYLYFVGRADDIFKSGGEKVAPKEIEAALYEIPGVREAAVIGVPDDILGQVAKACIVLEAGASVDEREVRRHCQQKLESHLVPKHIEFVADLPRTDTGKIRKASLS